MCRTIFVSDSFRTKYLFLEFLLFAAGIEARSRSHYPSLSMTYCKMHALPRCVHRNACKSVHVLQLPNTFHAFWWFSCIFPLEQIERMSGCVWFYEFGWLFWNNVLSQSVTLNTVTFFFSSDYPSVFLLFSSNLSFFQSFSVRCMFKHSTVLDSAIISAELAFAGMFCGLWAFSPRNSVPSSGFVAFCVNESISHIQDRRAQHFISPMILSHTHELSGLMAGRIPQSLQVFNTFCC